MGAFGGEPFGTECLCGSFCPLVRAAWKYSTSVAAAVLLSLAALPGCIGEDQAAPVSGVDTIGSSAARSVGEMGSSVREWDSSEPGALADIEADADADTDIHDGAGVAVTDSKGPDNDGQLPGADAYGKDAASVVFKSLPPCPDYCYCTGTGQCSLEDGKCIAATDYDCKKSRACNMIGRCHAVAGICVALSDEDCKSAWLGGGYHHMYTKVVNGECDIPGGKCKDQAMPQGLVGGLCKDKKPPYEKSCFTAPGCLTYGLCTEVDGLCVAVTDDDCKKSCKQNGRCHAIGGVCYPTNESECAQSDLCDEQGRCKYLAGFCVLGDDSDCAKSYEKCYGAENKGCNPKLHMTYQCAHCFGKYGYCDLETDAYCGQP